MTLFFKFFDALLYSLGVIPESLLKTFAKYWLIEKPALKAIAVIERSDERSNALAFSSLFPSRYC